MDRTVPEKIEIEILDSNSNNINGVFVCLTFHTDYKNNFIFSISPLNCKKGKYIIIREEIIEKCKQIVNTNLMDYGGIEKSFVGTIDIYIENSAALESLLRYYDDSDMYHHLFPKNYRKVVLGGISYTKRLEKIGEFEKLKINCQITPPTVSFSILK